MAHIVGERRNDIRSNSVANCPLGLCKRSAALQDTEKKTCRHLDNMPGWALS